MLQQFIVAATMTLEQAERHVVGFTLLNHWPGKVPTLPTDQVVVMDRGYTRGIVRLDPETGSQLEAWAYTPPGGSSMRARR